MNAKPAVQALDAPMRRLLTAAMARVESASSRVATAVFVGSLLLLAPLLAGCAGQTTAAKGSVTSSATTVSLTFDDGLLDQYTNALPALAAHGLHGTFYVNTAHIQAYPRYMTWAELHAVASSGNEVGGHTLHHFNLPQISPSEATREICQDRVNLVNEGFQPTDFAYPYGAYNASIESTVKNCGYRSARTVGGLRSPFDGACASCAYAEGIPPRQAYAIRTPDSVTSSVKVSDLQTLVTQAVTHGGGWVPIVFHDVCENACSARSISPANFNAFLAWLHQQVTSGAVSVRTVAQVIG
jgi:peptidoglycan/xylan/chitin deacetylase (PgdA/CDA1 family)